MDWGIGGLGLSGWGYWWTGHAITERLLVDWVSEPVSIAFTGDQRRGLPAARTQLVTHRRGPHPHDQIVPLPFSDLQRPMHLLTSMEDASAHYMFIDVGMKLLTSTLQETKIIL